MTSSIKEQLEKELKTLPKNFVAQIECTVGHYPQTIETALEFILKDSQEKGIYVTLSKPITELLNYLENKKINKNRLFIIDAITGLPQKKDTDDKNFVIISGPTSLTEMGIEIAKAKETGKYSFIFFDTLSTLLIYNSQKRVLQFSYFLFTKLRDYKLSGMFIFLKSDLEKEIFESLAHLSDKVIKI